MKLIIEGDYKKVKQLLKELKPRCKKDKVSIEIDIPKEKKVISKPAFPQDRKIKKSK